MKKLLVIIAVAIAVAAASRPLKHRAINGLLKRHQSLVTHRHFVVQDALFAQTRDQRLAALLELDKVHAELRQIRKELKLRPQPRQPFPWLDGKYETVK